MPDKAWKALERKVAKLLHGKRIPVSGISPHFKGDVEHDLFFIECKYGKQIPLTPIQWYEDAKRKNRDKPITLLVMKPKGKHGEFVLMKLEEFAILFDLLLEAERDKDLLEKIIEEMRK